MLKIIQKNTQIKSLIKAYQKNNITLSVLSGVVAFTFALPSNAAQDKLPSVEKTEIIAKKPSISTKDKLATFTWAGGCNDNRVQAWTTVAQSLDHRWNLKPVPISKIMSAYPSYEDKGAVFYIISHEKERKGCASKYLSGAFDCNSNATARRVQLWHKGDEKGVQWWNVVDKGDGTVVFENFYNKNTCSTKNMYLGTDVTTATRFNDLNYAGLNFKWKVPKLNFAKLNSASPISTVRNWVHMCDRGSKVCVQSSTKKISVSNSLTKSWSRELETSLSTKLSLSVTAGAKLGGGTPFESSAQTTASSEISSGLRTAVKKAGSDTKTTSRSYSGTLTCGPDVPKDRDVYRYQVTATIGNSTVIMNTCHFGCTTTGRPPTWSLGTNLDSCTIPPR